MKRAEGMTHGRQRRNRSPQQGLVRCELLKQSFAANRAHDCDQIAWLHLIIHEVAEHLSQVSEVLVSYREIIDDERKYAMYIGCARALR